MDKKKKNIIINIVMVVIGILYFFLLGDRGVVLDDDSYFYLEYQQCKVLTPIYATFVLGCKVMFHNHLFAIVVLQGILAIFSCLYLAKNIQKEFLIDEKWTVLVYIFSFLPYAYSLPEYVSTHSIMTESLSFSIFYLWFVCVMRGCLNLDIKNGLIANLWAMILMLIRFQLGFLFVIDALVIIYVFTKKRTTKLRLSYKLTMLGTIFFICALLFTKTYLGHIFQDHLVNLSFGKVFYVADEEDVELYSDEESKLLYKMIFDAIDNDKLRFPYARSGLWKWKDLKQTTQIQSLGYEIIKENADASHMTEIRKKLVIPLFKDNFGKYLLVNVLLYPESLVCALFIQKEAFYFLCYAITFFFFFSAIAICCIWRKKMERKYHAFMLLVLMILILNIVFTNLVIYGLQRYLVYTYGLFYIGYFMMIKNLIENYIKDKKKVR